MWVSFFDNHNRVKEGSVWRKYLQSKQILFLFSSQSLWKHWRITKTKAEPTTVRCCSVSGTAGGDPHSSCWTDWTGSGTQTGFPSQFHFSHRQRSQLALTSGRRDRVQVWTHLYVSQTSLGGGLRQVDTFFLLLYEHNPSWAPYKRPPTKFTSSDMLQIH